MTCGASRLRGGRHPSLTRTFPVTRRQLRCRRRPHPSRHYHHCPHRRRRWWRHHHKRRHRWRRRRRRQRLLPRCRRCRRRHRRPPAGASGPPTSPAGAAPTRAPPPVRLAWCAPPSITGTPSAGRRRWQRGRPPLGPSVEGGGGRRPPREPPPSAARAATRAPASPSGTRTARRATAAATTRGIRRSTRRNRARAAGGLLPLPRTPTPSQGVYVAGRSRCWRRRYVWQLTVRSRRGRRGWGTCGGMGLTKGATNEYNSRSPKNVHSYDANMSPQREPQARNKAHVAKKMQSG